VLADVAAVAQVVAAAAAAVAAVLASTQSSSQRQQQVHYCQLITRVCVLDLSWYLDTAHGYCCRCREKTVWQTE